MEKCAKMVLFAFALSIQFYMNIVAQLHCVICWMESCVNGYEYAAVQYARIQRIISIYGETKTADHPDR